MRGIVAGLRLRAAMAAVAALAFGDADAACDPQAFPVALDIGHSAEAPGAISARGTPERAFNVALGTRVAAILRQAGFARLLPIAADAPVRLADRAAIANANGAKAFLSLHHDSVQPQYLRPWTVAGRKLDHTEHAAGYSLFVSARNAQYARSVELATAIGAALQAAGLSPSRHHGEAIEGENRTPVDEALGIYRYDGLAVLRSTEMPAVLIEAGVIKNRDEERLLGSDAFRGRFGQALALGLRRFCGGEAGREPERSAAR